MESFTNCISQAKHDFGNKDWRCIWTRVFKLLFVTTCLVVLVVFFLFTLHLTSTSARLLTGHLAKEVLDLNERAYSENTNVKNFTTTSLLKVNENAVASFSLGQFATVMTQSSSVTTTVTASLLADHVIRLRQAIPIIIGSNVGTTSTSILVSFYFVLNKDEFRRGFAVAAMHNIFNIFTAALFLPTEWLANIYFDSAGPLEFVVSSILGSSAHRLSMEKMTAPVNVTDKVIPLLNEAGVVIKKDDFIQTIVDYIVQLNFSIRPARKQTKSALVTCNGEVWYLFCGWYKHGDDRGLGAVLLLLSCMLLVACLSGFAVIGRIILKEKASKQTLRFQCAKNKTISMQFITNLFYLALGFFMTFLFQSSSVITSILVPLVVNKFCCLRDGYNMILGSNLGTTTTVLFSERALGQLLGGKSCNSSHNLEVFVVHFLLNVNGVLIFFLLPAPLSIAQTLGETVSQYRWFALIYIFTVFVISPTFNLVVSDWSPDLFLVLNVVFWVVFLSIFIINQFQEYKNGSYLPGLLSTWGFLPDWMHSLEPWDIAFRKVWCCGSAKERPHDSNSIEVQDDGIGEIEMELTTTSIGRSDDL